MPLKVGSLDKPVQPLNLKAQTLGKYRPKPLERDQSLESASRSKSYSLTVIITNFIGWLLAKHQYRLSLYKWLSI